MDLQDSGTGTGDGGSGGYYKWSWWTMVVLALMTFNAGVRGSGGGIKVVGGADNTMVEVEVLTYQTGGGWWCRTAQNY